jgi:hypothetical protein
MMPSARPARPQHLRPPRPADDVGCRRAQNACTQHSERPPELEKVRRHVRILVDLGRAAVLSPGRSRLDRGVVHPGSTHATRNGATAAGFNQKKR